MGAAARGPRPGRRRLPVAARFRRTGAGRVGSDGRGLPRLVDLRTGGDRVSCGSRGPRLGRRARRGCGDDAPGPAAQLVHRHHRRVRPRVRVARPRAALANRGRGRAGRGGVGGGIRRRASRPPRILRYRLRGRDEVGRRVRHDDGPLHPGALPLRGAAENGPARRRPPRRGAAPRPASQRHRGPLPRHHRHAAPSRRTGRSPYRGARRTRPLVDGARPRARRSGARGFLGVAGHELHSGGELAPQIKPQRSGSGGMRQDPGRAPESAASEVSR